MHEQAAVVAGPNLQAWIDPVQADDLRRTVAGILHEWWLPLIEREVVRPLRSDYQA